ncbi:chemotaxis protein CheW [Chlorogloeopsis sp. ULAP02]|uniref:chemotaxis protein CheW n=1 Tax=Chlorogloeopsis sp. ULAP02 TaxID=3107926 RepID=UPI0031362693
MNSSKPTLALQSKDRNRGEGYLKFQLNRGTAAVLPVKYTQEAIVVPVESITSMPNMPSCILGLMNWRSRIVWIIDLPRMFNLESLDQQFRQYNIIIIRVESVILGLVVQEVKGTTKFQPEEICSPIGQVASSLVPYLCGCIVQQQEIFLVLDAQAITQSSVLQDN